MSGFLSNWSKDPLHDHRDNLSRGAPEQEKE
jgi:hypothetical protein